MSVMRNGVKMETVASQNDCATEQKLNFVLTSTVPLVCVVPIFEELTWWGLCAIIYNVHLSTVSDKKVNFTHNISTCIWYLWLIFIKLHVFPFHGDRGFLAWFIGFSHHRSNNRSYTVTASLKSEPSSQAMHKTSTIFKYMTPHMLNMDGAWNSVQTYINVTEW